MTNDDDHSDSETVELMDTNRISFYGEINTKNVATLTSTILEVIKTFPTRFSDTEPLPIIYLHIHSTGGCLMTSLRAYDQIRLLSKRVKIITVAEGIVASGATLIFLAGSERVALRNALFLFHQLSSTIHGKHCDIVDEKNNCDMLMKKVIRIMEKHSTTPKARIKNILKKEKYYTAKQCIKMGLVERYL